LNFFYPVYFMWKNLFLNFLAILALPTVGFFSFLVLATLGVYFLTLPALARVPWTAIINEFIKNLTTKITFFYFKLIFDESNDRGSLSEALSAHL